MTAIMKDMIHLLFWSRLNVNLLLDSQCIDFGLRLLKQGICHGWQETCR